MFRSAPKTAAAGFEEAKAKLGLVQSRSAELEKEAAALQKKASRGLHRDGETAAVLIAALCSCV